MLNRILIGWILYAGVMGFVLGGSFVAAYQVPFSQHKTSPQPTADQNTKEKSDDALARYTLWLTIFTGVMAFATVGLGIATVGLYATGEKQIEVALKAANAAAQSAEAQIAVEGARLICQPTTTTYWEQVGQWAQRYNSSPDMPLHGRTIDIRFILKNYGKTPATIREVNAVLFKSAEPPRHITITQPQLDLPNETVVASGLASPEFVVICRDHFSKMEEAVAIMNEEQHLWFHGRVVYDDVFGRESTHVFLYQLRHRGGSGSYIRYWDQTKYRQKNERT